MFQFSIDRLLKGIKEYPMSVMVAFFITTSLFFGWQWSRGQQSISSKCDEEVKLMRQRFIEFQNECITQLQIAKDEYRKSLDSVEYQYYSKYKTQEAQIRDLEKDLLTIKNRLK